MSFSEDEKTKSSREFKLGYFRASVDGLLFLLKSILILNAGALASILVEQFLVPSPRGLRVR